MNDTTIAVQRRFEQMLMKRTPEERLRMGCSMFTAAREITKSSIRAQFSHLSPQQMRQKIFLRFYGNDFTDSQKAQIQNALIG